MRFNGTDPRTLGRGIRIKSEKLPGKTREMEPVKTSAGKLLGHIDSGEGAYTLELGLMAETAEEMQEAWMRLAAWAEGDGGLQRLEPGPLPQKAYDAALEEISPVEKSGKTATVKITWMVLDPHPYSIAESKARGENGSVKARNTGSRAASMVIEIKNSAKRSSLTVSMDGEAFFAMEDSIPAGAVVVIDMARELVTVEGTNKAGKTDWQKTDYSQQLPPGEHTVSTDGGGEIVVRWHNRWA